MIVQLSPPRTGSTVIWQMLQERFGPVEKAHGWEPRFEGAKIIATMRDPRDMCASMWRVEQNLSAEAIESGRKMSRREMADSMLYARTVAEVFQDLWTRPDVLWLQYERFWNDLNHALDAIGAYLGGEITRDERRELVEHWNLDENRKRSDQLERYTDFDDVTHIHGCHIATGEPGYWRRCVQPLHQDWFSRAIMREFEGWGI